MSRFDQPRRKRSSIGRIKADPSSRSQIEDQSLEIRVDLLKIRAEVEESSRIQTQPQFEDPGEFEVKSKASISSVRIIKRRLRRISLGRFGFIF